MVLTKGLTLSGCAGESSGLYDAEYDCEQSIACIEEEDGISLSEADYQQCVQESERIYRDASRSQRSAVDGAFERCAHLESCDYVRCATEQQGGRFTDGASGGGGSDPAVGTGGPPGCDQDIEPGNGAVESSVGPIAYSDVEVNFRLGSEDCLNRIIVTMGSASCYVRFTAEGLVDSEERFLITEVRLHQQGLCPGYPDVLTGGGSVTERASERPLGTITIARDDVSWDECAPGQLLVEPDVTLRGTATDRRPEVELVSSFLLSGTFGWTTYPLGNCPVEYY